MLKHLALRLDKGICHGGVAGPGKRPYGVPNNHGSSLCGETRPICVEKYLELLRSENFTLESPSASTLPPHPPTLRDFSLLPRQHGENGRLAEGGRFQSDAKVPKPLPASIGLPTQLHRSVDVCSIHSTTIVYY